jgi:hypothetical protein
LKTYVDHREDRLVFTNPNGTIAEQLQILCDSQKNPFEEMYNWCKGEIYDIQAMTAAVDSIEALGKKKKKAETKKTNT